MNLKRMMILALLLTLGSGMGFADPLTNAVQRGVSSAQKNACSRLENEYQRADCEKYLKTIQNNEYLEFFYSSGGYHDYIEIKDYKIVLTEAAEKSVEKYNNYSAYRNAAIVYMADDFETKDISDSKILKNSAIRAKHFATKAIERSEAQSVPAPEMYFVRALTDIRYYGLVDYGTISHAKKHALDHKDVLENNILPDLEKVGKISPYYTPWDWMEFMYDTLDLKAEAQRCHDMQSIYGAVGVN